MRITTMNTFALYIHFPYCLYKCHYCDFNSYPVNNLGNLGEPYVEALQKEWNTIISNLNPFKIRSIFFGGGTPSLFSPSAFEKILSFLKRESDFDLSSEITLEMNPKTVTEKMLEGYLRVGINRFSVGIQSFQDQYLSPLGRLHTGQEAHDTLHLLKEKGVKNLGLDLMFGFPGQTTEEVLFDLKEALQYSPQHLSFYHLTPEPNTLFYEQVQKGELRLPENDQAAEMYQEGTRKLMRAGFDLYEISNLALAGYPSRHNLTYWRYQDYLGLGAGAVSFVRETGVRRQEPALSRVEGIGDRREIYGYRWTNPKTPKEYFLHRSYKFYRTYNLERIDFKTAAGEFWMMGLRLREGVSLADFEDRFGPAALRQYERVISKLEKEGGLTCEGGRVALSSKGWPFANDIVSNFLL